jgi:hypothetical protein
MPYSWFCRGLSGMSRLRWSNFGQSIVPEYALSAALEQPGRAISQP